MKAIILISSIFYILGLKVGNNINLGIDSTSVNKVIPRTIQTGNQGNTFEIKNTDNLIVITDSTKTEQSHKSMNISE